MWFKKVAILLLVYSYGICAETPITIGNQFTIISKVLNEDRRVSISLPRSYGRSPKATYDVLYLLDGNANLRHTVGSQYFLAGYRQMPELIIVGIHNTNRNRDYTPTEVEDIPKSGGAVEFRTFISKELFPFIDTKYRTTQVRYLSGHSYGGLFALDTLVNASEMFDAYFTFSPSLRWDNDLVLNKLIDKLQSNKLESYLYVNIGNEGFKLKRPILKLHETLKANKNNLLRWKVDWLDDENHSTTPVIGQFLAFRNYFSGTY
jgi:predicted alpha/beta superfamily hydrolase